MVNQNSNLGMLDLEIKFLLHHVAVSEATVSGNIMQMVKMIKAQVPKMPHRKRQRPNSVHSDCIPSCFPDSWKLLHLGSIPLPLIPISFQSQWELIIAGLHRRKRSLISQVVP